MAARVGPHDDQAHDFRSSRIAPACRTNSGWANLGHVGFTFGLGFSVRLSDGMAPFPGSAGEFAWAGFARTEF